MGVLCKGIKQKEPQSKALGLNILLREKMKQFQKS